MLLDRDNESLNILTLSIIILMMKYYRFTFDIPTEIEIQQDMEEILKKKKKKLANTTSSLCSITMINKKRDRDRKK